MNAVAPLEAPSEDERTFAILAHIFQIFTYFIGPLVIYFAKRNSRFVAFHALQALFLQLLFLLFWMIAFTVMILGTLLPLIKSPPTPGGQAMPVFPFVVMAVGWISLMGIWLINVSCGVIFAVKAQEGNWSRHPLLGSVEAVGCGVALASSSASIGGSHRL